MIKYLCDIKDCGREANYPDSDKDWTGNEMVDMEMEGASYFWARFGFASITLCVGHRKKAVEIMIEKLRKTYEIL